MIFQKRAFHYAHRSKDSVASCVVKMVILHHEIYTLRYCTSSVSCLCHAERIACADDTR
jgi:hypothetical protein